MTPTTYGRDFAYCLKSHGGVRGFNASLWRFLLRCTLFCHSVATFLTSVSSYEGGCGFEVSAFSVTYWRHRFGMRVSMLYKRKCQTPEIKHLTFSKVVVRGFEPRQTEPKPVVLPLHHRTKSRCKVTEIFLYCKILWSKMQSMAPSFAQRNHFQNILMTRRSPATSVSTSSRVL